MTRIAAHVSGKDLEANYEAADPVAKRHFHALWLLSCGYEVEEVAELVSLSTRWVWQSTRRYNAGGPEQLGDRRCQNRYCPQHLDTYGVGGAAAAACNTTPGWGCGRPLRWRSFWGPSTSLAKCTISAAGRP
jgi:Homeodomain-like domain